MARMPLAFTALEGLPEISQGVDLAQLILISLGVAQLSLKTSDVLVVAQKIISKAEGRTLELHTVEPSNRAIELAAIVLKDPRFVQAVLSESSEVLRAVPHVLITRHRSGFVMANAGIDRSNVVGASEEGAGTVLLLPLDCDASAFRLSNALGGCAVIVSDSFGRPWREGVVNVALGVANLPALVDLRGEKDRQGRTVQSTEVALADAVAAGAGIAMGEAAQSTPIVHVRGVQLTAPFRSGQSLLRPIKGDLFL